jgi:DNA-binding FrmR family transcriptional regulator
LTHTIRPSLTTASEQTPATEPLVQLDHSAQNLAHNEPDHLKHHPLEHKHVHSEASLKQIINRLSRIEGHIRGVKTMVAESRPCPEVLVQIAAVKGAIDRVSRLILDEHLTECVARAAKEGNIEAEMEQLKSALDRFLP